MLTAVFLITAWHRINLVSSVDEQTKKMRYIYNSTLFSQKKENPLVNDTIDSPRGHYFKQINQTPKDKFHMISLI
jgi:hypothetical protein